MHDAGHAGPPNNWNPWILSNLLALAMLVEDDEVRQAELVHRALRGLDTFLSGYHSDGGCDEGITYWERAGAAVYDCLDVLDSATGGVISVWDDPLIKEMGRYVYRAHIGGAWYVNFADGSARTVGVPNLVYHYGQRIGDDALTAHGIASQARDDAAHGFHTYTRVLRSLFQPTSAAEPDSAYPLVLQSWLDGIEVLTARETEGSEQGLFLAAKGGNNGESHNHNDIGSFIVGLDGQPVLIDVGVGRVTRRRHSAPSGTISGRCRAHSTTSPPSMATSNRRVRRVQAARQASASLSADLAELSMDIAGAWAEEAGVERWNRTVRLERGPERGGRHRRRELDTAGRAGKPGASP